MPALANASKDLLSNGPDESGLSANLSQLEFLTKARATGAYLLQVHTCLQSLIKNISSFRNRIGGCNILADVVEFGDFDNAFLSRSPTLHPLDKESEILIDSIANDLMTVSDAFTHNLPADISKEEFICLRSMLSCFSSHKAQMINYVDRLWRQAVTFRTFKASDSCDLGDRPFWAFTKPTRDFADSISNNSSGDESDAKTSELNGEACESSGDDILFNKTNNSINQTRFLSRLTVTTNYSHLKNLLTLMTALNIEKLFITRLSDNIWKHMFLPWLELTEHSRIRWRFFQSSTFSSQNIWQLDLLEAFTSNGIPFASHPHASHSKLTTSLVRLRSVLTDLHTHLFGLPLPAESITKKASKLSHLEDISIFDSEGRPRRVIDIAVASYAYFVMIKAILTCIITFDYSQ
ncbi:unnamed protein product [Protopolystoma xenopodis]|uniref:Uncharacterized protein n=1 Tax=Protopolystoma xenopodis TaxID=117903 RepID=A0A3S5AFX8_9PLAT|nr:unnamed protein product [Protopolystoma xenopodis]